jgi:hypothetical protein
LFLAATPPLLTCSLAIFNLAALLIKRTSGPLLIDRNLADAQVKTHLEFCKIGTSELNAIYGTEI